MGLSMGSVNGVRSQNTASRYDRSGMPWADLPDPGTLAGSLFGVEQMTSARFVETLGLEALHD